MKDIQTQATNSVNIIGKVLSTSFRQGKTSAGKPYESANLIIRVNQEIEGKKEVDEIPVSIFASQYTNAGSLNPMFETVQKIKTLKTIQNVGVENADTVRLSKANLQENFFTTKSGQFIDTWQLRGSFCNTVTDNANEVAKFTVDIYIMDMHDELNRDGDTTGRLIIKGGIVQYDGKLDVVNFVVEDPNKVDYLQRNWEIDQTVHAGGYIRYTVAEDQKPAQQSSWGETFTEDTTRIVRELVIAGGSDEGLDEENSYDPVDIKKAFNARKALIEQKQIEVKKTSTKTSTSGKKFDWEE